MSFQILLCEMAMPFSKVIVGYRN